MAESDPTDITNMDCFYDSAMMNNGDTLTGPDCDVWGTVLAEDSHAEISWC
jgi:hypothetical protein